MTLRRCRVQTWRPPRQSKHSHRGHQTPQPSGVLAPGGPVSESFCPLGGLCCRFSERRKQEGISHKARPCWLSGWMDAVSRFSSPSSQAYRLLGGAEDRAGGGTHKGIGGRLGVTPCPSRDAKLIIQNSTASSGRCSRGLALQGVLSQDGGVSRHHRKPPAPGGAGKWGSGAQR